MIRPAHSTTPPDDRLRQWLLAGLTATLTARLLYPSESVASEGDGLPSVMLWFGLAFCWCLDALRRSPRPIRIGPTTLAIAALVAWHSAAAVWAVFHVAPRPALNMLWEWVGFGFAFFLARQLVQTQREGRAIAAVMIAMAVGLSAQGGYQMAWEHPRLVAAYHNDPDATLRDAGCWAPPGTATLGLFESRLTTNQPLGGFALTNSLAGYLAPWLVVGACVVWPHRWNRPAAKLAAIACLLAVAACLALTGSRSGMIAVGIGLTLAFVRRKKWWWGIAAAALIGGILLCSSELGQRAVRSFGYRVQYWQSTLKMIGDHPVWGAGPGNFQTEYTRYKLPEASEEVADPHNFALEIWATAGTPALLALAAVLGCFAWQWSRPGKTPAAESGESSDGSRFVWTGLAAGCVLALPLGFLSLNRLDFVPIWLDLPVALASLALLWPWVEKGSLAPAVAATAVVTLLIHLSASGGIGFPGVANSLWVLMALAINCRGAEPTARSTSRLDIGIGLVALLAAGPAFYFTGFAPAIESQRWLRAASTGENRVWFCFEQAIKADPWSPQAWYHLSDAEFGAWQKTGNPKDLAHFEQFFAQAIRLDPHSSSAWRHAGDQWMAVYDKTKQPAHAEKAATALEKAVEFYPNDGDHRAALAIALKAVGDEAGFRRAAARALELDDQTPHADKKLAEPIRQQLTQGLGQKPSKKGTHE